MRLMCWCNAIQSVFRGVKLVVDCRRAAVAALDLVVVSILSLVHRKPPGRSLASSYRISIIASAEISPVRLNLGLRGSVRQGASSNSSRSRSSNSGRGATEPRLAATTTHTHSHTHKVFTHPYAHINNATKTLPSCGERRLPLCTQPASRPVSESTSLLGIQTLSRSPKINK